MRPEELIEDNEYMYHSGNGVNVQIYKALNPHYNASQGQWRCDFIQVSGETYEGKGHVHKLNEIAIERYIYEK